MLISKIKQLQIGKNIENLEPTVLELGKREYFENLDINFVNENKTFWRTVKPYFSNKNLKNSKIILVENNEIITDNRKNAEIMNNYSLVLNRRGGGGGGFVFF